MLIVNAETIKATRQKLNDPTRRQEVIDNVKKMIDIKQTLQWRSDAMAPCCGGSFSCIACQLDSELDILERIGDNLEKNRVSEASVLLEEYERMMTSSTIKS